MRKLYDEPDNIHELKLTILHKIQNMAKDAIIKLRLCSLDKKILTYFHKCLFVISEDWDESQLSDILHESY